MAYYRWETSVTFFTVFILQVDFQNGFATFAYFYITHINIFNDPTAAVVGFDADDTFQVRAVHFAVFNKQVLISSRNLTAYNYTTVSVFHFAIAYNDIFTWYVPFPSVRIPSAFNSDAVVSSIEYTVFN